MKNVYYTERELPRNNCTDNVRANYTMHTNREEVVGGGGSARPLKRRSGTSNVPNTSRTATYHCLTRAEQVMLFRLGTGRGVVDV